jgi:HEAT repeat protein/beta-lactamase regulating signal transducer with metallopeptidase domain
MEGFSIQGAYPFLWLLFLLDFALKGTAILVLAFAAEHMLIRKTSAATRHLVWFLALLAVVVLPMATNLLPEWRVPLMPGILVRGSALQAGTSAQPAAAIANAETPKQFGDKLLENAGAPEITPPVKGHSSFVDLYDPLAGLTHKAEAVPFRTSGGSLLGTPHWSFWIFAAWFTGFMVVLFRLLVGAIGAYLLLITSRKKLDVDLPAAVSRIAEVMGVRRRVRLLISDHMPLPKSGGILFPVIILPAIALEWEEERRSLVLMHEMAHIKRWDILTLMVSRFACALNWFNPLVWMAHLRMRNEMENACDDLVINSGIVPSSYALHLAEIARSLMPLRPSWASAAMAHRCSLKDRLLAILNPAANRRPFRLRRALISAALTVMLLLPLAAFHPWASAESPKLNEIAEMSGRLNPETELEDLLASLSDSDENVRANAALLLGGWMDLRAAGRLMTTLQDNNPRVRQYAAWSLGRIRMECCIEALAQALRDPAPEVRQQALWALGQIGEPAAGAIVAGTANSDPFIRQQSLHAMGSIADEEAIAKLIAALDDEVNEVRRQAVIELARIGGSRVVPGLTKALSDPNTEIRRLAVSYLREVGSPQAVQGLAAALQDDANPVRRESVTALGRMNGDAAIDPLVAAATGDPSNEIRIQALRELEKYNDIRVFPAYAASINSDSNAIRRAAVHGLCRLDDDRVVALLNATLIESYTFRPFDDEIRLMIIDTLGRHNSPSSRQALLYAVQHSSNAAVRDAAQRVLSKIS